MRPITELPLPAPWRGTRNPKGSGLRLGIAYAWTMMILAEMFAVPTGFGHVLWRGYEFMRMDIVIGGMIMLGLFGYLSDRIIVVIARRKLAWAQELSGNQL